MADFKPEEVAMADAMPVRPAMSKLTSIEVNAETRAAGVDVKLEEFNVPTASMSMIPSKFVSEWIGPRDALKRLVLRCKLNRDGQLRPDQQPLTGDEIVFLVSHCRALLSAPLLTSAQLTQMSLRTTLLMLAGKDERVLTSFPDPVVGAATAAFDKFEGEGWASRIPQRSASPQKSPRPARNRRDSRLTSLAGPSRPRRKSSANDSMPVDQKTPPPRDHPIYGVHGIMRGIQQIRTTTGYKYEIYNFKVDSKPFGHNGLTVGQWWPIRRAALRDGAHGTTQAGISSTKDEGARSIVISSQYEDCDIDNGEMVWYSMPKSDENKDPNNYVGVREAEGMRLAWHQNKPLRVLQTKGAGWPGRPCVGVRYDGLYRVVEEQQMHNKHGGLIIRFRLVRDQTGQPTLETVRTRPTAAEIEGEKRIRAGY